MPCPMFERMNTIRMLDCGGMLHFPALVTHQPHQCVLPCMTWCAAAVDAVTAVSLQEDSDMAYFNLDITAIQARCAERGDIKHVRFPIRDFDPYDLRR